MKKVILILAVFALASCTDATIAKFKSFGDSHTIELYSGGELVRSWVSTGKVESESSSDGYVFMDKETNKIVRVTGDLVISVK